MNNKLTFDQLKIAGIYDRARTLPRPILASWRKILLRFVSRAKVKTILDLGTGTGLLTAFLRDAFQARVIGVDPSRQMLAKAKKLRQKNIKFVLGRAENIRLPDRTADLVFMSMVFPHIKSQGKALSEISRVLRPGGYAAVIQATKETNRRVPFFKFFPESRRIADRINPPAKKLRRAFEKKGFRTLWSGHQRYKVAPDYRAYYKLIALRGYSVLRLIPDRIFNKRLQEFAKHLAKRKSSGPVYQTTSLFIFQKQD